MTRTTARLIPVAVIGVASASLSAQPAPTQPPKFETATTAVVVDLVARDQRGPVVDLTQADFEILEDGKPQQIATFERRAPEELLTRVGGEAAVGAGARTAAVPPIVVALAWDRLSPEGRALARKAAQTMLESKQATELMGVLTYTPTNPALDGTYRKIQVKAKRPGVEIRARSGYLAVPANEASPVLEYETEALAALAAQPRPTALAVRAAALSVPMPGNLTLTALLAGFSGDVVTYAEDQKLGTYSGEAAVVARVVDVSGTPIAKQSQLYQLTGRLGDLPKVRSGSMIFFRLPEVVPGQHTAEFALYGERQAGGRRRNGLRDAWRVAARGGVVVHRRARRAAGPEGSRRRDASSGWQRSAALSGDGRADQP